MRLKRALFAVAAAVSFIAVLFIGCDPAGPTKVVDGWPVGEPFECRIVDGDCWFYEAIASTALDHRDPGHAPIVSVSLHRQAAYRHENGEFRNPICLSGCDTVVLFKLVDGSFKAIGAGSIGVSQEVTTRDYGPLSN